MTHDGGIGAPRVAVEDPQVCDQPGAKQNQVEGADQFLKVNRIPVDDGLLSIPEEVPHAPVAPVEGAGVPGEQRTLDPGQRPAPRAE